MKMAMVCLVLAAVALASAPPSLQAQVIAPVATSSAVALSAASTSAQQVRAPRKLKAAPKPTTPAQSTAVVKAGQTADAVRIALILTFLAIVPALVLCMTPFVRIIVVLSMIRHAFGMPETPPNQVLVILALF